MDASPFTLECFVISDNIERIRINHNIEHNFYFVKTIINLEQMQFVERYRTKTLTVSNSLATAFGCGPSTAFLKSGLCHPEGAFVATEASLTVWEMLRCAQHNLS